MTSNQAESCNRRSVPLVFCDPVDDPSTLVAERDIARFWLKVDRRHSGCWLWTASVQPSGYGQFHVKHPDGTPRKQITLYAHRLAYALTHGPIPAGVSVLHRCDVPRCCNPEHLFLGTHTDNMRDAATKGRLHVPRPQRQKLTDHDVEVILSEVRAGVKQSHLAARYGVTKSCVSLLVHGRRRQLRLRHLDGGRRVA